MRLSLRALLTTSVLGAIAMAASPASASMITAGPGWAGDSHPACMATKSQVLTQLNLNTRWQRKVGSSQVS